MDQRKSTVIRWLKRLGLGVVGVVLLLTIMPLPKTTTPFSTALYAADQSLMGARIASDGQWRFPISDSLPLAFEQSLLHFEDEYFKYHPGVNPVSLIRAIRQNISAGKVVSGGSTITMQLARILRGNKERTMFQKLIELAVSFQLELRYTKAEILEMYAGLAPFGGNVVGLEAAAWRYYGRAPELLSIAECATLAVLPNAPSLIYPGKEQEKLRRKRNKLLAKLYESGILDLVEYELGIEEPLPQKPYTLPLIAPHMMDYAMKNGGSGERIYTSLQKDLQHRHQEIANRFHDRFHDNEIHNLAILVAHVKTGEILSYIGNSNCTDRGEGVDVDIIQAPRSSGSILKPLLYAAAIDDAIIAPESLLPDIPTRIAGFAPKNFDGTYNGAISSADALTRSLNIPAVRLLQMYGLEKFHNLLQELQFSTIRQSPDHYGLSLILGGAEVSLFDLVSAYRNCAIHVKNADADPQNYVPGLRYIKKVNHNDATPTSNFNIDPSALWLMMDMLSNVERPREEDGWTQFASQKKLAWKTGTSFGHRDAWAIGMNAEYVMGVWVGNADGEGRPGLTGLNYAGPVLFDVFNSLGSSSWFTRPNDELIEIALCGHSGYRLGRNCTDTTFVIGGLDGERLATCDRHTVVNVTVSEQYQVNLDCTPTGDIHRKSYFQLPVSQAYFYRKHNSNYPKIPPWHPDCQTNQVGSEIEIVYPFPRADIAIPRDLNGAANPLVLSAAYTGHRDRLHWHLDDEYIGTTSMTHSLSVLPRLGDHVLHVIDDEGVEAKRSFRIVE